MMKNIVNNDYVFKGFVVLSAALIGFGAWKISSGVKTLTDVAQVEDRIDSAKISIMDAQEDIRVLKEEFEAQPISKPIDIVSNGHIIIQALRGVGEEYGVSISFSTNSRASNGSVTFTEQRLNTDPVSGMRFFEGSASIDYDNYGRMKEYLSFIEKNYPITVDSVNSTEEQIQIGFKLYGV